MINSTKILYTYIFLNVLCMGAYAFDKLCAKNHWRRTSEKALILWAVLAPFGAGLGMVVFRHKTRKWYFKLLILIFILSHIFMAYKFMPFLEV